MDLFITTAQLARASAPPLPVVRIQHAERAAAPLAIQGHRLIRRWLPLVILALITLIGGAFRFYRLTYPALWNDEALVYWRVCGTYGQMLKPLGAADAFPPLHYSLYWALGHLPLPAPQTIVHAVFGLFVLVAVAFLDTLVAVARRRSAGRVRAFAIAAFLLVPASAAMLATLSCGGDLEVLFPGAWTPQGALKLTPFVMRLVPAICGTLNIPAVYFLARQLLPKKTSLLAAAFTACSSFMLFYSRDAKMYPDLWLLVTLNVACLWRWFGTYSLTDWLCWVATGCGMVGLHASALILPALSVLFLFTQRTLHWTKVLWFLLGIALIVSGPIGYYTKFNTVIERVEENGWQATGIGWVGGFYNGKRTGPDLALYATSSFLIGYEWPRDDYVSPDSEHAVQPIATPLLDCPETAATEVMWILAIAALPWPLVLRPRQDRDPAPQPQWRIVLWLGAWILLVGYGFYCHSIRQFVSPSQWDYELGQWLSGWGAAALLGALATFVFIGILNRQARPSLVRFGQLLLVIAALYGGCLAIFEFYSHFAMEADLRGKPLQSIWEPRYLGFVWPAVGIAVAALLLRLPTRPVRIACIIFVFAVNLAMAALRMELTTEPPIDLMARDVVAAQDPRSRVRTFDFVTNGDIAVAGTAIHPHPKMASGRYYLEMQSNREPMSPDLFVASYSQYKLRNNPDYGWFKQNIASSPQLKDVIIWSQLMPWQTGGKRTQVRFDPYGKLLGPAWKLAGEQVYTIRIYWDWRERWKWVRREYVRK